MNKRLLQSIFLMFCFCKVLIAPPPLVDALQKLEQTLTNLATSLTTQVTQKIVSATVSIDDRTTLAKKQLSQAFKALNVPLRPDMQLLKQNSWHITLAYLLIPVPIHQDATLFQNELKKELTTFFKAELQQASYTLKFKQFEIWDRFYVARYEGNKLLENKLTDIVHEIQKKYPGTVQQYPDFKPHISILKFAPGNKDQNDPIFATIRAALSNYNNKKSSNVPPISVDGATDYSVRMHVVQ